MKTRKENIEQELLLDMIYKIISTPKDSCVRMHSETRPIADSNMDYFSIRGTRLC